MKTPLKLLAECPYCPAGIGAFLVLHNLLNYRIDGASGGRLDAEPENKLIVYNTNDSKAGRCKHLFDVLMDISWDASPDNESAPGWTGDFDLVHTAVPDGSETGDLAYLMRSLADDVIYGAGEDQSERERRQRFVPKTECRTSRLDFSWDEFLRGLLLGEYFSQGRVCFVEDIESLILEMRSRARQVQRQIDRQKKENTECLRLKQRTGGPKANGVCPPLPNVSWRMRQ